MAAFFLCGICGVVCFHAVLYQRRSVEEDATDRTILVEVRHWGMQFETSSLDSALAYSPWIMSLNIC